MGSWRDGIYYIRPDSSPSTGCVNVASLRHDLTYVLTFCPITACYLFIFTFQMIADGLNLCFYNMRAFCSRHIFFFTKIPKWFILYMVYFIILLRQAGRYGVILKICDSLVLTIANCIHSHYFELLFYIFDLNILSWKDMFFFHFNYSYIYIVFQNFPSFLLQKQT